MSRENAMTVAYKEATIFEHHALFTPLRIDRATVPEGMFLYEIRHEAENWGAPCQLARHILVNYYGSILTSDPIQFPPDGGLTMEKGDFRYIRAGAQSISEFLEKHPSTGKDVIDFYTIEIGDGELFYSQNAEQDRANGCIGHLRGDFGREKEFWTTWWPHQNDKLNQEPFKNDLDRVVNWLRQDTYPLKDFQTMEQYCNRYEQWAKIPHAVMPAYGFQIETKRYQYMLRCAPIKGDYNFYIYCYDKEARERERAPAEKKRKPPKKKRSEPER